MGILRNPDIYSELTDTLVHTMTRNLLGEVSEYKSVEKSEVIADHVNLIASDVRRNKGKAFSQGQVSRLEGVQRIVRLKPHSKGSFQGIHSKVKWDNSSSERFIIYTNKFRSKKHGYVADNMVKWTTIKRQHKGTTYALTLDNDEHGEFVVFITSHLLERLAERKGLDIDRTESLAEVLGEIQSGMLVRDFENGNVWVYGNDGICPGVGYSLQFEEGEEPKVDWNNVEELLAPWSFLHPTPEKGSSLRFLLLKTYVTNEMANERQIENAQFAVPIKFEKHRMVGMDKEMFDYFYRNLNPK